MTASNTNLKQAGAFGVKRAKRGRAVLVGSGAFAVLGVILAVVVGPFSINFEDLLAVFLRRIGLIDRKSVV